ncbi:MAG: hypothetical protein WCI11_15785 [Candidatus Methylumidiphilus sp.]
MTETEYKPFDNLEELAEYAGKEIQERKRYLNLFLTAELSASSIRKQSLADVTDKAESWRAPTVPDNLIINHGVYSLGGIEHIVDELKEKPSSNRALYSLISQKDIVGSGDNPIPSFMIFQCAIDSDFFYCTVYFRALEIANFFRINLEEIRLNICDILNKLPSSPSVVRLAVLAFSAYKKPDQIPLEKCELDLMSAIKIMDLYDDNPSQIPELLDRKAKETTVVELSGLKSIKEWLCSERKSRWPAKLNVPVITAAIDEAILVANDLRSLRCRNSHDPHIDEVSIKFVTAVEKIAAEFRK